MSAVRYNAKECPCCGKPGHVKTVTVPHSHGWVGCPSCGLYIQWNWDPKDALEKWNRRTDQTTIMYEFRSIDDVIQSLKACTCDGPDACDGCFYIDDNGDCTTKLKQDAIKILEEVRKID